MMILLIPSLITNAGDQQIVHVASAYERGVQRVHRTRARVLGGPGPGGPGMFKKCRVSQQHKHVKVPQIIKRKELRALLTKNKFFQLRISNLDPYW